MDVEGFEPSTSRNLKAMQSVRATTVPNALDKVIILAIHVVRPVACILRIFHLTYKIEGDTTGMYNTNHIRNEVHPYQCSSAATIPYAAAAAAPPTINVLNAPHTYPPGPRPAAPVTRALTAPKMSSTTPVTTHDQINAMCATGSKKYGRSGMSPPTR